MQGRETTCSARSSRQNNSAGTDVSLPIQTAGELFDDGHLIELVGDAGSMWLLLSDGDRQSVASRVTHRGRSYSPLDFDRSILQALTLPTRMAPRESTRKLFDDARELFQSYDFPEDVALRATYFSFATWFPDCLPVAPCFVVTGPGAEAHLLFELLGCLVRHPLPLVHISMAGLRYLPQRLNLTLLIGHPPTSERDLQMLLATTLPDSYLACGTGIVNLYGARAVYLGSTLNDDISQDALFHVHLGPSQCNVPIVGASDRRAIALRFQPRFLGYRVRNVSRVRTCDWEPPRFVSALRVLARVLAACMVDAPELQAGVGPLLQGQQEDVRAERWFDLRCIAIEALLAHCHSKCESQAYVGEITHTAVTISKSRGQTATLEPRRMGTILRKSLGFFPTRDNKGYKIVWTYDIRRRIHKLARDFEVESVRHAVVGCDLCAEIVVVGGSCRRVRSRSR